MSPIELRVLADRLREAVLDEPNLSDEVASLMEEAARVLAEMARREATTP